MSTLAVSANRGRTSSLTSLRLLIMFLDDALITSSGYGTPILLNLIPARSSIF
jgi:hypothetical protein